MSGSFNPNFYVAVIRNNEITILIKNSIILFNYFKNNIFFIKSGNITDISDNTCLICIDNDISVFRNFGNNITNRIFYFKNMNPTGLGIILTCI